MRKIKVKDIKNGMVLAEPLESSAGVILMDKGIELKESFAPRLAQRGILIVCVEGEPGLEDIAEEHFNNSEKIPLEILFERKLVNAPMKTIYEALARHRNASGT
jgi:hypothetical protein